MVIRIENPETLAIIAEISKITGEDAETVVEVALRTKLARLDAEEAEALRRIQNDASKKESQEPLP